MVITEYPDLQRIRKELNLLQKLYGLYNQARLSAGPKKSKISN